MQEPSHIEVFHITYSVSGVVVERVFIKEATLRIHILLVWSVYR